MLSGINGFLLVKGRNIRKVMGGGGARAGEVQKNIFVQGKIKWKKFMHAN